MDTEKDLWIRLDGKITNHWLWDDSKSFQWWVLILFEVKSANRNIKLGNKIIKMDFDCCSNTIRTWGNIFKCSTKAVMNFFHLLEENGIITREVIGSGKYSITIIKINDNQILNK